MSIYVTRAPLALLGIEKSSMIQARDVTNHLELFHRREARETEPIKFAEYFANNRGSRSRALAVHSLPSSLYPSALPTVTTTN